MKFGHALARLKEVVMPKTRALPQFEILDELYQLPYLFGFWLSDPEEDERLLRWTGEKWTPKAYMFLGETMQLELDLDEDPDVPGRIATYVGDYAYEIDGADLIMQRVFLNDDDELVHDPVIVTVPWGITDDGRLTLDIADHIWWYVPASVDDLVAAGFNRPAIEHLIKQFRDDGDVVIEKFDLEKARELIDEAWRQELIDNGLDPNIPRLK